MDEFKLQIEFPKSDQDHRLQLVGINGSIFAIVFGALESNGPINLLCEEWSLVLLAPIKSKQDIVISGINIICLNEVVSEGGSVTINASNQLVKLSEDPAALIHFYKLFDQILDDARNKVVDAIPEAQKNFIVALCGLHDKIKGPAVKRDLAKELQLWGISCNIS